MWRVFYTADATAGFPFGVRFEDLEYLTTGRTDIVSVLTGGNVTSLLIPHSFFFMLVVVGDHRLGGAAPLGLRPLPLSPSARTRRRHAFPAFARTQVIVAAYVICAGANVARRRSSSPCIPARSCPPRTATFYELYAIAAAVLGGFSLRGGEGSIVGVILGTILLQELQNLVNLLGIPSSLNFAVMGGVILIGVLVDQQWNAFQARRRIVEAARAPATGAAREANG